MPNPARKEVSLMVVITCDSKEGIIFLNVWGRIIYINDWKKENPWEWAASNWPFGIAFNPPRTISATTAAVYKNKANEPFTKIVLHGSRNAHPSIHKSNGVLRKSSI